MSDLEEVKTCKTCGTIMEKGYISRDTWTKPRKWIMKLSRFKGMARDLHAFRCPECGVVELYTSKGN